MQGAPLDIELLSRLPANPPVLVVGAHEGRRLTAAAKALDSRLGGRLRQAMAGGRFTGAAGQHLDLLAPAGFAGRRAILVGLGKPSGATDLAVQDVGGRIETILAGLGEAEAVIALDLPRDLPAYLGFGAQLASQRFTKLRTRAQPDDPKPVRRLSIVAGSLAASRRSLARLNALATGVGTARILVNEPANLLGPEEFAARARALLRLGVKVEVLEEAQLRRLGMGALLAVGTGSHRRPRMLVLRWKGPRAKKGRQPIAFVGKGVCFDAGGLDIKRAEGMEEMKADMAGAAAVVGVMQALALRKAPIEAVGIAALVENMPSERSYRPGDIVKAMSGETIEVINTDAEGRLILSDALYYTVKRFKPRAMIDLATLTHAVGAALGRHSAGLLSNDDVLSRRLIAAGEKTGEHLWRLPLGPAYEASLESGIADLRQIAPDDDLADASHGAQLLQHFVGKTPWAHLDIAYTGMYVRKEGPTQPKGATGFGVRLLDALAQSYET
jgi:leucyl aminopeptidase